MDSRRRWQGRVQHSRSRHHQGRGHCQGRQPNSRSRYWPHFFIDSAQRRALSAFALTPCSVSIAPFDHIEACAIIGALYDSLQSIAGTLTGNTNNVIAGRGSVHLDTAPWRIRFLPSPGHHRDRSLVWTRPSSGLNLGHRHLADIARPGTFRPLGKCLVALRPKVRMPLGLHHLNPDCRLAHCRWPSKSRRSSTRT